MVTRNLNGKVTIREVQLDDIPAVYRLGHQLFHNPKLSTLYRTWNAHEITNNFNQNPRLSLVAASNGRIAGFALGTTYEKESGGWRYGHLLWMGVSSRWQRSGIGRQLYHEMERRMHQDGVRMVLINAPRSNTGAIRFFKRMGYGKPETEVWMSKVIQRTRKNKDANQIGFLSRPKRHNRMCRRVSKPFLTRSTKV